jgi:M6 family metalloprotease-like protein
MAQDAVGAADAAVDFSRYDSDGDGRVDYLILVHVGSGQEFTGEPTDIWSQTLDVAPIGTADGVSIDTFIIVPEYWFATQFGRMTIGVYVHEFGHLLGLPDLYDYGLDSKGIGDWELMALGMWNGPNGDNSRGESPSWMSAWSRVALGWVVPEVPVSDVAGVTLPPVGQAGRAGEGPCTISGTTARRTASSSWWRTARSSRGPTTRTCPGTACWSGTSTRRCRTQHPDPRLRPLKHEDCNWPATTASRSSRRTGS